MLELLIFGTFWFWLFVSGMIIWIIYGIEKHESGVEATILLIASFIVLYFLGAASLIKGFFSFMFYNPGTFIFYVFLYIFCGILYGIYKWYIFCLNRRDKAIQNAKSYRLNVNIQEEINHYKPDILNHKGTFIRWMTYWPFSAIWTLLNDPIRRLYNSVFNLLSNLLQKISDNIFKDVEI
jgi:hypothetical protein